MALLIHYIGTAAAAVGTSWRQNRPPAWDKNMVGETDSCRLVFQGPQYLEKDFLDALVDYSSMIYKDENGVSTTDTGMKLTKYSSDDAPIFPVVTLFYEGCRGGGTPDPLITNDRVVQSASTTFIITDSTSPNYNKSVTMSIQYYAARTSYEWAQLSDPAGVSPYTAVEYPITYSGPFGDSDIFFTRFSGMFEFSSSDPSGVIPSNTISIGDATAVWNSFTRANVVTSLQVKEITPGQLWKCNASVEALIISS